MVETFLFRGGRFLDPRQDELVDGVEVLVEGDTIREVSETPIKSIRATVINLAGRTLMPGLIDAHFHMYMNERNIAALGDVPMTYAATKAARVLHGALMRGFTTIRDVAGGDWGMRLAATEGLIDSPRLFVGGRALSPTGGHGDFRRLTQDEPVCNCCSALPLMSVLVDGVSECLKAVREELRKGADHIKIMASGGIASENDPLDSVQFSTEELAAITDEARRWGSYVCAHAYGDEAIDRAVRHGVRTIEHGNFLRSGTAQRMAEHGAFLVPTLIAYSVNDKLGGASGKSPASLAKNQRVLNAGAGALEIAASAGVAIGFGTDLSMHTQSFQCDGLSLHAETLGNVAVLRSATLVNARILRQEGRLGELVPGAFADILVLDGDPTKDLSLFKQGGANLSFIMKSGLIYKNTLQGWRVG